MTETQIQKIKYINNVKYLDWLYYTCNKQRDFNLQVQGKWNSKRYSYTSLRLFDSPKNDWWLEQVNNRTILQSEICLDYDLKDGWTKQDVYQRFRYLVKEIRMYLNKYKAYEPEAYIYDTTSNGYHVHIFNHYMLKLTSYQRELHRLKAIKQFGIYKELDVKYMTEWEQENVPITKNDTFISTIMPEYSKVSEGNCIALEWSQHNKTGKIKHLIYKL